MEKRFLTIKEASEYLNLSIDFLYKMTAQKAIPHTRFGRKILFDLRKLEGFISENSVEVVNWEDFAQKMRG